MLKLTTDNHEARALSLRQLSFLFTFILITLTKNY